MLTRRWDTTYEPASTTSTHLNAPVTTVLGHRWVPGSVLVTGLGLTAVLRSPGLAMVTLALTWLMMAYQRILRAVGNDADVLSRQLGAANRELAVLGSRLERGVHAAGIQLWEHNLSNGDAWTSGAATESSSPGAAGDITAGTDEIHEQEFRLIEKDGKIRWILARSQTVRRGADDIVIGAHIDVTDRHEHTALVEQLNRELTRRNSSLREFTQVASHDLRSPLRAIVSLVGFLREDVAEIGPVAEHHLERIEDRVGRMSRLIDDLLIYARAHGEQEQKAMTDLDEVMDEILDTLEVPEHLMTVVDCDLPPVQVARTPLAMCIRNLVDNAYKHHGKAEGRVAVRFRVQDQFLQIEVADDGVGIDPAHIDKIFQPFRRMRVDESTPGSGIGLSVIERAAEAHGGSIEVRSTFGVGTTFTLWWPYAGPTTEAFVASAAMKTTEPTDSIIAGDDASASNTQVNQSQDQEFGGSSAPPERGFSHSHSLMEI